MNAEEVVRALKAWNECHLSDMCVDADGKCWQFCNDGDCIVVQAIDLIESLQAQIAASQRRERAHEAAIKRHYADMTSQCFICYSCVNHDARGHWNGKEPYACSGCGKSHPKWRFDEGRFAQEGTK